jgi:energy-coupling factor transport system permease protein
MTGVLFSPDHARPWLARLDPRLKLVWVFTVSVAAATIDGTAGLAALALATAAAATGLRLRVRGWGAIVGLLAILVWGTMLSQGFFFGGPTRTPIFTLVAPRKIGGYDFPGIVLAWEGLWYGAVQSLRLVATVLAGLTASLSTGPERMMAALTWFRLPASVAYMTTAALRFLPVVFDEVLAVRQARRLRGYRFRVLGSPGDRLGPYRAEIALLFPVVAASLRRAETLAESITARGFDPRAPRTFYPPLVMRAFEKAIVVGLAVSCVALVVVKMLR